MKERRKKLEIHGSCNNNKIKKLTKMNHRRYVEKKKEEEKTSKLIGRHHVRCKIAQYQNITIILNANVCNT